jgi:hypothetical protein
MKIKLYLTALSHEGGDISILAATSSRERNKQLLEYCAGNWDPDDEDEDEPPPNSEMVEAYYDRYDEESYAFDMKTIEIDEVDAILAHHEF